ncbi:gliding motility-associated C-terminal domain-containing protein [Tenacibaculum dicentrarchi]|nr:gliding motility-associated C-terminal domain-containing protein [Tenacibaculum dicentrarchi]
MSVLKNTLLFFCLSFNFFLSAQKISIGNNEGVSENMPLALHKNGNYSQFIYLGSEIKTSGNIKSLTFKLNTTGNLNIASFNRWTLGLKEVAATTTELSTFRNSVTPFSGFTRVFDGYIQYNQANGEVTVVFSTPFKYNHTKNLVVEINENSGGQMPYDYNKPTPKFQIFWTAGYRAGYRNKYGYVGSDHSYYGLLKERKVPRVIIGFKQDEVTPPVITMQNPAEASICKNNSFVFSDVSVTENPNLKWTTDGAGVFEDDTKLLSKYTPSEQDATKGFVILTLTATKESVTVTKTFKLSIQADAKSAGTDGILTVCKGVNPTEKELFDALKGAPETGGVWVSIGLVHTYTQTTSLGCNPQKATITVKEETDVKSAGEDGVLSILKDYEPTEEELFAALNGFATTDGSWVKKNSNTYIYTITSTSPCVKNTTATIRIKRNQKTTNAFSPNGDGVNDTWIVLPDIANKYPKNTMCIYNRHGNLVYKALRYNNDWDGTSNGKITLSKKSKLPAGPYVYILELNNATKKVLKGWVYINY